MKKLYLKQQVFSFRDRFTIKDEMEQDLYYVSGSIISLNKKLTIHDSTNQEVARIEEKLFKWLPQFSLVIANQEVAIIKKKLTFLKPSYVLEGTDITASGDFLSMNFTLARRGKSIATIKKAWFSWGDSYEISIIDSEAELLTLGLVLAINFITNQESTTNTVNN